MIGLPCSAPRQIPVMRRIPGKHGGNELPRQSGFLHSQRTHPGNELVIDRHHLRFGAVLADLVRVQPADAAVLIGLVRHRLIGRCDQTVGHIEMLMRRNGLSVLFMRRHRQDING